MQLARLAVSTLAVVVVDAIGDVARLLGLEHERAGLDGVERARVDLEEVALVDGHLVQEVAPAALLDKLGELLAVLGLLADDDGGVGLAVEHVPALLLAQAAVLVHARVLVVGVDLDGEVAVGVENLDEQREAVALGIAEELVALVPELRERGASVGPLLDEAVAVRVGADGPALANLAVGDVVVEDRLKTAAAPDLVMEDGLGEDEVLGHGNPFSHGRTTRAGVP